MHVPGLYTNCVLCRLSVCSIEPVPYNFVNDLSSSVQTSFLVHLMKGTAVFYKRIYPYACFSFLQTINNHPVVTQESYQDLGIIISEDLFWKLHYELTTSRAYKILGLMRTFVGHNALVLKDLLVLVHCAPTNVLLIKPSILYGLDVVSS